ncbi:type II toxin-antitoxin system Phd/YefM family antitoxin [Testudinibacter sp. P27/CKL/0425]
MKVELVTSLKRQATQILADLNQSKEPVLITEYGKPAAYLLAVDDYQFMQQRLAILEGIARGERALAEQEVLSHGMAQDSMAKWLK